MDIRVHRDRIGVGTCVRFEQLANATTGVIEHRQGTAFHGNVHALERSIDIQGVWSLSDIAGEDDLHAFQIQRFVYMHNIPRFGQDDDVHSSAQAARVECVLQAVREEVHADDHDGDCQTWKQGVPRRAVQVALGGAQHVAP